MSAALHFVERDRDVAITTCVLVTDHVLADVSVDSRCVASGVSRELGIPCVAGVYGASRRIPDGATIEVDGTAGTVTVISV